MRGFVNFRGWCCRAVCPEYVPEICVRIARVMPGVSPPSGHVFRLDRVRGPVWYAKYRLPDGRQVQRKIGPAWTERGRLPAGYVTKRLAEAWLRDVLDQARRGTLPGMVRTGATFADAAAEFLRYAADDRDCKPSTMRDYRSIVATHLVPHFGEQRIEDITPQMIEAWRTSFGPALAARTKNKWLVVLHGVFRRAQTVWGLPVNPVTGIEKYRQRSSGDIDVFSPEEVLRARARGRRRAGRRDLPHRGVHRAASRRAARAALARRGLRGPGDSRARELRRRPGHVAEVRQGALVPMAPDVASALAALGRRERWTGDDDLVFVGTLAGRRRVGAAAALHGRAAPAGLRPLRFHDLRHTFGTRMIAKADIRRVQEWMGHADVQTTMKYLHYAPRDDDAALVAEVFRTQPLSESLDELRPRVAGDSRCSWPHQRPQRTPHLRCGAGPGILPAHARFCSRRPA